MENNKNDPLEDINKVLDDMEKKLSGKINSENSEEDEKDDPAYILLQNIIVSVSKMVSTTQVKNIFETIKKNTNEETSTAILTLLSIVMTYSAHNALLIYDELLKKELQNQFDNIGNHINYMKSDLSAHEAVLNIHKKDINELKKKIQIDKFKGDNGLKD